jgi:1-acyl-sn-glycerol-3-phosphate acyltransferase
MLAWIESHPCRPSPLGLFRRGTESRTRPLELADLIPTQLREQLERLDPLARWREMIDEKLAEPAFQRDPEYLETLVPYMALFASYFDAEVHDLHRVPDEGGVLLVGNHSGGGLTPDTSAVWASWYEERGYERPLIGLGFDAAFTVPVIGDIMRKIGQVPASRENAAQALDEGLPLLVYPGGDKDLFRPWTERNVVDFHGRTGFIKLALEKQVPVVPVVGHGGHDAIFILSRGEGLARMLGAERLRLGAVPIIWQLPWGVSPPIPVYLPLPAKITVQVCEPLDWSEHGPEAAEDPVVLQRCYDEVIDVMQGTLDRLSEANPYPLLGRIRSLLPWSG